MAFAPYLLALSLVAGELRAGDTLESQILLGRSALQEELPEIAVSRLRKLVASQQFDVADKSVQNSTILLLGESLVRNRQADEASGILSPLPDSAARHYWLGLAQAQLGNHTDALAVLLLVADDDPKFGALAQFNRLKIFNLQKDEESALAQLESLSQSNPEFRPTELALTRATLLLQGRRIELAKEVLSKIEEPDARVLALIGRAELASENPEEALVLFDKCLADSPLSLVRQLALLGKGDALLAQKEESAALETFLQLLNLAPSERMQQLLFPRLDSLLISTTEIESRDRNIATLQGFLEDSSLQPTNAGHQIANYYRARLLPDSIELKQLQKLLEEPTLETNLSTRIRLNLAESYQNAGKMREATAELEKVLSSSPKTRAAALAADQLARLATRAGRVAEAESFFAMAAQHPSVSFSETALLNQALLALAEDPEADLSTIADRFAKTAGNSSLDLETALASARSGSSDALEALTLFLAKSSDHPRAGEAKLALVSLLIREDRPDLERIRQLLNSLPKKFPPELEQEKFLASHQLGAISDDWTLAVLFGESALKANSELEQDPYFLLRLGESRFRNGDYDRARFLFGEVSRIEGSGDLQDIALYFAARANLAIPTDKATLEALATLDELMERSGPLSTKARLLKARTLLENLGRAKESLTLLASLPGDLGGQPEAALLAAEAHRELGRGDPAQFQEAISIYQTLLDDQRTSYARSNQLHYLIARTHRENGHPELALEPCYTVVDFENRTSESAPAEWDFYYRCGFEALDLLLEAKRYRAALLLAQKLAKTAGPGAIQAKERADQIQLEHMILTE